SHDDRPALIYVQQGEIVEYASNCAEPILHKAGDIRPEVFGTSHWWKNLGTQTVILYVGDVRTDPHDYNMYRACPRLVAGCDALGSRVCPARPGVTSSQSGPCE